MTLSQNEQSLIDTLKIMPPNSVYTDAPKITIFKGFQLFTSGRVKCIRWEEDAVLAVDLAIQESNSSISSDVSVRINPEGSSISTHCTCGGDDKKCEHIICALMAILHVLNPRYFNMTKSNPQYRFSLEQGLLKASSRPLNAGIDKSSLLNFPRNGAIRPLSRYHIVIEISQGLLRAYVEINGRRISERDNFQEMPSEIAYLARCSYQKDMSYILPNFLRRADNLYPLFINLKEKRQRVQWLGDKSFKTWTELDIKGDDIIVRKGFAFDEQSVVHQGPPLVHLLGNMAFTEDWTGMCYIVGRDGWRPWEELQNLYLSNPHVATKISRPHGIEMRIPVSTFRQTQIYIKKSQLAAIMGPVRCMEKGTLMSCLNETATKYSLVISRAKEIEGVFVIEPQCSWGSYVFRPSQRIMAFARHVEWGQIPASLRTRKRKPLLYEAFFQALSSNIKKGLGEKLKETVNEATFGKNHFATEARRIISYALTRFREDEIQFHYTNQGWRLISPDKDMEKLLFLVPYSVFGTDLFERLIREGSSMVVREEQLLERLHLLQELTAQTGVELSFDQYPVKSVTWELELDATSGTIDWFEIKPEIKCNGKSIPRGLWAQALARKGVVVQDGSIQILTRKSLDALAILSGLLGKSKQVTGRSVVSVPRLRMIDLLSLKKQGILVKLTPDDESIMDCLVNLSHIESRHRPVGLKGELRHYQQEGYEWLSFLYENRFGACLADDMGLGKTIQAVSLMAAIKEGKVRSFTTAPFLIVVPPSLIFNWEKEIERFYPELSVYVYRGKDRSTAVNGFDVILTSYGLIRRDIVRLKEITFRLIVFDEAQAIKNIFADTTSAVRQLKAHFKVALTGTPVENHVGEYFSIVDLVLPGLLGDYRDFQGRARRDISALLPVITERTKPFVLRRTKELILKELPPKIEQDVYLELTEQQKKFYNRTVQDVKSTIESAYRTNTASQAKIIALTAIMRLRQICLSPQLLVHEMKESSPKVDFLKGKIAELSSESHCALVFSQFTSFLDIVEDELKITNIPYFRLDGSTPVAKRKEIVEAFQNSTNPTIFLLSLKAGGQGLNLTRAAYVFHLDPWWNPAVENQASDRSHRIGQTNTVFVTRLLMRHTVEEKMMTLKHQKQGLYRALMEAPEKSVARSITREDFNFLLS
jgi:superfamily II DNA or RNA helicase